MGNLCSNAVQGRENAIRAAPDAARSGEGGWEKTLIGHPTAVGMRGQM